MQNTALAKVFCSIPPFCESLVIIHKLLTESLFLAIKSKEIKENFNQNANRMSTKAKVNYLMDNAQELM